MDSGATGLNGGTKNAEDIIVNHSYRIIVFIGLIMTLAFAASANASNTPTAKSTLKSIERVVDSQNNNNGQPSVFSLSQSTPNTFYHNGAPAVAWINQMSITLMNDEDGDGYHHYFRLQFDANTRLTTLPVVAKVYLNNGTQNLLMHTTAPFTLYSDATTDAKEIATSLTQNYPTQAYDMSIELYDANNGNLLYRAGPQQESILANLYLEDMTLDRTFNSRAYIHQHSLALNGDRDNDGYYHQIRLSVDVDSPVQQETVRIGIDILDPELGWKNLTLSSSTLIQGNSPADTKHFDIALDNGYKPSQYPLRITLLSDANNGLIRNETITQTAPLESADYDTLNNNGRVVTTMQVSTSSSGGSASSLLLVFLGLTAVIAIRQRKVKADTL